MKFTAIFFTGAALAQHAVVLPIYGPPQPVNPLPGKCTPLPPLPIRHAITTPDIGLRFYTGHECDGEQVATSIEERFKPTGDIDRIRSVKTVYRDEFTNEEASYYIYWGRY